MARNSVPPKVMARILRRHREEGCDNRTEARRQAAIAAGRDPRPLVFEGEGHDRKLRCYECGGIWLTRHLFVVQHP